MNKENITLKDLLEAIRKNGLPKVSGNYLTYDQSKLSQWYTDNPNGTPDYRDFLEGGCALGQASVNLGIVDKEGLSHMDKLVPGKLHRDIARLNDNTKYTLPEIADIIEARYPQLLDRTLLSIETNEIVST